jgi:hypothetical protein
MGLLVLLTAFIETISDTITGRESNYWEYDYENYHNLCTMLEEKGKEEEKTL